MTGRRGTCARDTGETSVRVRVDLGGGDASVNSGVGFLDHLVETLARHARIGIEMLCTGDLHVDDHHTVEDCALALGAALDDALGERRGVARFGSAYAPLDDALARAVVDLSGRPHAAIDLGLRRERLGALACENIPHFVRSLATAMRAAIHLDVLRGENDHHRAEAAFKALALALRAAVARDGDDIPSTKGTLS